jgi:hypothetical protein
MTATTKKLKALSTSKMLERTADMVESDESRRAEKSL